LPLSGLCFTFRRGYLNIANDFIGELTAAGEPAPERCDKTFLPFTDFGSVRRLVNSPQGRRMHSGSGPLSPEAFTA
jgi:hypothetical protein